MNQDSEQPSEDHIAGYSNHEHDHEQTIEDPKTRKLPGTCSSVFLVLVAALESVLTSGVVFGWAPLQIMLQEEGVYAYKCQTKFPCEEQAVQLQMMYTLATSAFCFCVWPTGLVLDSLGPRICCMMGALLFGAGCFIFAISTSAMDLFMLGYILMAVGGLPIVLSMMHLANLLPAYSGTIITILNVMIDVSSLNLKVMKLVTDHTPFTRKDAFSMYVAAPAAILITAPCLWPRDRYEERGATNASQVAAPSLKTSSFWKQVRSAEFLMCAFFTAFHLLHINLYIGTVDDQLRMMWFTNSSSPFDENLRTLHLSGYAKALHYEESLQPSQNVVQSLCSLFAWILPLGGLVMTLPVGYTLDNFPLWVGIALLSAAAILHSVCTLIARTEIQIVGFLLFAYYRAALFGTMATTVAFTFGYDNFGKLWGTLYAISGLFNFSIEPLAVLAQKQETFYWINLCIAVVSGILFLTYPPWLRWKSKDKSQVEEPLLVPDFTLDVNQ